MLQAAVGVWMDIEFLVDVFQSSSRSRMGAQPLILLLLLLLHAVDLISVLQQLLVLQDSLLLRFPPSSFRVESRHLIVQ